MFELEKGVLDMKKAKIERIRNDEIFLQVHKTENYWISNCGRLINNLRGSYHIHKMGNVHYTINEIDIDGSKFQIETCPSKLVAEHFLEPIKGESRIWFIDRDKSNNYYKNLMYVSPFEYSALQEGRMLVTELGRSQVYIPYATVKGNKARDIYNGMYMRCYDMETKKQYPHYAESTMYEGWKKDFELFQEWYESNYYECENEQMVIDKDLLCKGNKQYAPDKCCILPWTLNVMLSNCKRHYARKTNWKQDKGLPYGVRYDQYKEKYYGQIRIDKALGGDSQVISLSNWDTPEQAFAEYKRHKEACILLMADKYKDKIPKKIYDALCRVEVEPW
jgi:hypothetical protein